MTKRELVWAIIYDMVEKKSPYTSEDEIVRRWYGWLKRQYKETLVEILKARKGC